MTTIRARLGAMAAGPMGSRSAVHPAVDAWRRVQPGRPEPENVETVKQKVKSAVYRLDGVGLDGSPVVAKLGRRDGLLIERALYLDVLSRLPVPTLRYYGFLEHGQGMCWLFLEHANGRAYSPRDAADRMLAGRWLAKVHIAGAELDADLPDRGPRHYIAHLRSARDTIARNLSHPELSALDQATLKATVAQCDLLEARWGEVERACEGRRTLVHGDFAAKNARVRRGRAGPELLVFDWEFAGSGVPAVDLAQATRRYLIRPDLTAYWSVVRSFWVDLEFADLRRLAVVGAIFRWLAAISWKSQSLDYKGVFWHVKDIDVYRRHLTGAMTALVRES